VIVLDASALLAFLFREPGHEQVEERIDRSCLSAVNLSEVLGRFARDGKDVARVSRRIADTTIEIVPFSVEHAEVAASLVPATRALGLSLGDRACLALATTRRLAALTADRTWVELDLGISIELVR
jgi:PIN domain nuclease of toxin-antitoxin system